MNALFDFLNASPALYVGSVFVLGLLVGSFLNVVIYRLPIMLQRAWREQYAELAGDDGTARAADQRGAVPADPPATAERFDLVAPRSRCNHCGHRIRAVENIPVLSYLLLGGRCSSCGTRIGLRYPLVELTTGVLSAVVAWHFGAGWTAVFALVFTWALIAAAGIDLDHQLLPDLITLPLLWLGLLVSLASEGGQPLFVDPRSAILGAAAGYLSLWLLFHVYRLLTGKEGMGYGDFKLLGALGAWLGWQLLPLVILLSAVVGAVTGGALIAFRGRDHQVPMPFGPFLAAAGWVALLWGRELVGFYLEVSGLG
jgi:leader peptidase (prepilin peptidase)/N-methyltransferase